LVHILVFRGIVVRNLRIRCTLACKIDSETTLVYRVNLAKWVGYKTRDPIEFKRGKESTSVNII
jgi:hypothetical protein